VVDSGVPQKLSSGSVPRAVTMRVLDALYRDSAALTFSALYVIYIVAENQPYLCRKIQPIDIGLTEY
jgi:hypothetical protein